MKFDLLTGGQEIKLAILVKFDFSSCYFVCLVRIFLLLSFADGLFQFHDSKVSLKQAPGHNHENTIFQTGHCPFE